MLRIYQLTGYWHWSCHVKDEPAFRTRHWQVSAADLPDMHPAVSAWHQSRTNLPHQLIDSAHMSCKLTAIVSQDPVPSHLLFLLTSPFPSSSPAHVSFCLVSSPSCLNQIHATGFEISEQNKSFVPSPPLKEVNAASQIQKHIINMSNNETVCYQFLPISSQRFILLNLSYISFNPDQDTYHHRQCIITDFSVITHQRCNCQYYSDISH